ncbi:hypothetical protein HK104_007375 [Borealophlyctis nickersoniae]|nr:hypothetical protein HK104_007375 [Borealophlyctis nickersoniae]
MSSLIRQTLASARAGVDSVSSALTALRPNHATSSLVKSSSRSLQSIGKTQGSGWAGIRILGGINTQNYDVVMISPRNHFVFTPLLASTAVGTLEFRAIVESVRTHNHRANYYQAWCDEIDLESKTLVCKSTFQGSGDPETFTLPYDKLIVAVGAYSNTFGVKGVTEYGFFLKEVDHARRVRAKIIDCFEQASQPNVSEAEQQKLLHFAVVGGGPTGIEFSAELHDFVVDDLAELYPRLMDKVQISVYDVAEKILGGFDSHLAEYATKKFTREGIKIRTKTFIKEVQKNKLILKDDTEIPFGVLVWATGITATPLTKSLTVSKDPRSKRIITDEFLRVLDAHGNPMKDVYALGDCATIKDKDLPATAQVAGQKGIWLRKHLNMLAKKGEEGKPFKYHHRGSMVYTGNWTALLDYTDAESKHHMLRGKLAWFIWRSAYLTMSLSNKNKALIPMYWYVFVVDLIIEFGGFVEVMFQHFQVLDMAIRPRHLQVLSFVHRGAYWSDGLVER